MYEMSTLTRERLQGQCDFLKDALDKGAKIKANFLGRVVVAISCMALHAEFFFRLLAVIALSVVNCAIRWKREQVLVQMKQAYTALALSMVCFRTIFQPEMLSSFLPWLIEKPEGGAPPEERPLDPEIVPPENETERRLLEEAKKREAAYLQYLKKEQQPISEQDAAAIMQASAKEAARSAPLPPNVTKMPNQQSERFGSYVLEKAQDTKSNIQQSAFSFDLLGQEVRVIGMFAPQGEGPRVAKLACENLQNILVRCLTDKKKIDAGTVLTAVRDASHQLQRSVVEQLSDKTLHRRRAPLVEDTSSMTLLLIVQNHMFTFNIGKSMAVLRQGNSYRPLTVSADPRSNSKLIKMRGGQLINGRVNGTYSFATALGNTRTWGATDGLGSVTYTDISNPGWSVLVYSQWKQNSSPQSLIHLISPAPIRMTRPITPEKPARGRARSAHPDTEDGVKSIPPARSTSSSRDFHPLPHSTARVEDVTSIRAAEKELDDEEKDRRDILEVQRMRQAEGQDDLSSFSSWRSMSSAPNTVKSAAAIAEAPAVVLAALQSEEIPVPPIEAQQAATAEERTEYFPLSRDQAAQLEASLADPANSLPGEGPAAPSVQETISQSPISLPQVNLSAADNSVAAVDSSSESSAHGDQSSLMSAAQSVFSPLSSVSLHPSRASLLASLDRFPLRSDHDNSEPEASFSGGVSTPTSPRTMTPVNRTIQGQIDSAEVEVMEDTPTPLREAEKFLFPDNTDVESRAAKSSASNASSFNSWDKISSPSSK
jgi:hypothetical protein